MFCINEDLLYAVYVTSVILFDYFFSMLT